MVTLALDSATPATSVAVLDGLKVVSQQVHIDARRHAEVLSMMIDACVKEAATSITHLTSIVVGVGPGAFTGLRVGIVTAQSLGGALSIPVHGVMSLDAMAFEAGLAGPFAVVSDARRKEVFWARYTGTHPASGPFVGKPDIVARELSGLPVVGAAATPFAEMFDHVQGPRYPSAAAIGLFAADRLASGGKLREPSPIYLRRPDATELAGSKSVLT